MLIAIAYMSVSTLAFAGMHACVRHVAEALHPFEIAFFRNFFGIFTLLPWFVRSGFTPLRTQHFRLHLLRASINIFAMLMFFSALTITALAKVQALSFTAPLFATLLAILILGERVRIRRWAALAVGFAGTLIILRPGIESIDLGSLLVVGSAAIWACALIVIKVLSRTDSAVTITTYMVLLMTPMSLIPALFFWQWPDGPQLFWLALVGILGTLAQMGMAQAFRLADATAMMPFDFLKLIWGALLGYLLFSEIPDIWTWIGGAIIFCGAMYIAYRENQLRKR